MRKNFLIGFLFFMILFFGNVLGYNDNSSSTFITKSSFEYGTILKLILIFGLLIIAVKYFLKRSKGFSNSTKKLKENIASLRNENIGTSLKSPSTSKRISLISKLNRSRGLQDKQLAKIARKMKVTTGELALAIQIRETNGKTIG